MATDRRGGSVAAIMGGRKPATRQRQETDRHGPVRLHHHRRRPGRRVGRQRGPGPRRDGRRGRSRPVRRFVPVLGLRALEVAAQRGQSPRRRRRLRLGPRLGPARLHDQPGAPRLPRRLGPRPSPRGGRRDGLPRRGTAQRPAQWPGQRSCQGHGHPRRREPRARGEERVHRRRLADEDAAGRGDRDRPHLDEQGRDRRPRAAPQPPCARRRPDRRRAGPGLRPVRRAGRPSSSRASGSSPPTIRATPRPRSRRSRATTSMSGWAFARFGPRPGPVPTVRT